MRAAHVSSAIEDIPVDFFGDPDGCWDYDQLAGLVGFDPAGQLSIGALTEPYAGFPDGAAVVMFASSERCAIALVDCVASSSQFAINDGRFQSRSQSRSQLRSQPQSPLLSQLGSALQEELRSEPWNDSWDSALGEANAASSESAVASAFVAEVFPRDGRRNDVAA